MPRILVLAALLPAFGCLAPSQEAPPEALPPPVVVEDYEPTSGQLRIGPEPERAIPLTEKGHTLILPAGPEPPRGLVVFLDGWRVTQPEGPPGPDTFDHAALRRGVGLVRLTTGNPLDFYFDDAVLRDVATRLQAVLDAHGLADVPLFFAGLSLGGTRALKLAVFLTRHADAFRIRPRAVAVVDAPLDMVRFYAAEQRAARDAVHPAAADEGRWVSYLLESHLGGSPDDAYDAYVAYSPFVHTAPRGGNAVYLADLPLRAYHEPDVDWWIAHRGKSYYQMNSLDLAALINALRLQGNARAELVTTYRARDGVDEGSSPHTWTIVDDDELVAWFLDHEAG